MYMYRDYISLKISEENNAKFRWGVSLARQYSIFYTNGLTERLIPVCPRKHFVLLGNNNQIFSLKSKKMLVISISTFLHFVFNCPSHQVCSTKDWVGLINISLSLSPPHPPTHKLTQPNTKFSQTRNSNLVQTRGSALIKWKT